MYLKTLQESLKDLEIVASDKGQTEIFITCGNEKFDVQTIRLSHIAYINGAAITNQIYIDLKKLINM